MAHIGTLPDENQVLSPAIIPLFGILCPSASEDKECYFCMEKITKGQFFVMKSPCCGPLSHTECFKTWGSTSHVYSNQANVHCAYCQTPYPYKEICFLCLQEKKNEDPSCTNCCHTKLHWPCATDLLDLVSSLTFDYTLECGELTYCNSLWLEV